MSYKFQSYKAQPSPAHSPAVSVDLTGEGEAASTVAPNDSRQQRDSLDKDVYERQRADEKFNNLSEEYEYLEARLEEQVKRDQLREKEMKDLRSQVKDLEGDRENREEYIKDLQENYDNLRSELKEKERSHKKLREDADYNKRLVDTQDAQINEYLNIIEQRKGRNSEEEEDSAHPQSQRGERESQEDATATFAERNRMPQRGPTHAAGQAREILVAHQAKTSDCGWAQMPPDDHRSDRGPDTPAVYNDTLETSQLSAQSDDQASDAPRSPEDHQDAPQTGMIDFDHREDSPASDPNLSSGDLQKTSESAETQTCFLCAGTGESSGRRAGIVTTLLVLVLVFEIFKICQYWMWMQANEVPPNVLDALRIGGRGPCVLGPSWLPERLNYHAVLAFGIDRVKLG